MAHTFGAVIMAAGQGTRLKMDIAKPLAPVAGKTLVDFPINATINFFKEKQVEGSITAVTGHQKENVESYLADQYPEVKFAFQKEQLGTADAIRTYFACNAEAKDKDYTLILSADTPLIRKDDLTALFEELSKGYDAIAATFMENDPTGYGRIVRSNDKGFHIVEEKDADEQTKKIQEVNAGLYVVKTSFLLEKLQDIDSSNNSGEFYLTDLFKDNYNVAPMLFQDSYKFMGVNTLKQLELVGHFIRTEKIELLRESGVRFIDSSTVYIDWETAIESGTTIYPQVIIEGKTHIGSNVTIAAGSVIKDSTIEDGVEVKAYCHLENSTVRKNAVIGPFARLRPAADIGEEAKIGNFVEVKKATLDKGAKVSHLSYVGDAHIGEETNIGCGFITCNYDGANKHFTKIGKNSFIGSDSQMVAPVEIGDNCFVASGSTITNSMPDGAFAISRARQVTKEDMAKRFIKTKK